MKINIDGAFTADPCNGGWGFIIRDGASVVAGSGTGQLLFPQSALHSEAEASLQGLTAAMNWGMTRIIVESDCQVLVKLLMLSVAKSMIVQQ
jgi:ribonuclease HI